MLRLILWATIAVATVVASGDFVVLHRPATVKFTGNDEIRQSQVKEIFSAVLGMTVKQRVNWSGMSFADPFTLPEAVVAVVVEGVDDLRSPEGHRFPLKLDEAEETTWQALSGRLEERVKNNTLVRIRVGDGLEVLGLSTLGKLRSTPIDEKSLKTLKVKNSEDRKILDEIQLLYGIANNVKSAVSSDGKPDVYWLVVSGIRPLIERDGKDSPAVSEALLRLNNALHKLTEVFMKAYSNDVVIVAFTNDANKVRNTRSINLERERREEPKAIKDDSDKDINTPGNSSTTPVIESIKNDEEESEKNEDEEAKTRTSDEGSSLKKDEESPPLITESYETTSENKDNEANEPRESSTVNSDLELDNTTRNNEYSNTGTENTNRPSKIEDLNLAKKYNDNYPAIFNIILWFGVAFVFSLIAICIAIADMDPGRDSIIYRMTSTRMKKDN